MPRKKGKALKKIIDTLLYYGENNILSTQDDIRRLQGWIEKVETRPRLAIRYMKRKTQRKYSTLEKEIAKELEIFERTGESTGRLKEFQDDKISRGQKSLKVAEIRLKRYERDLVLLKTNPRPVIERRMERMGGSLYTLCVDALKELVIIERKQKLEKINKRLKDQ